MTDPASRALRRLWRIRDAYGADAAAGKRACLAALRGARLRRAADVLRLHEALCFLRAYPDDRPVLTLVERMLRAFPRRADLRRHRAALADSGIAGTAIRYRFFAPTAEWLARRWPGRMRVDWARFRRQDRLEPLLPLLAHHAETPGLDEWDLGVQGWVRRLAGRRETDAAFLARRFAALAADPVVRETVYDGLDIPVVLAPGPGAPSRTLARHGPSPVAFVREGLRRVRPVLPDAARHAPRRVRPVGRREAEALIDLAREAMVTRQRDLDIFCHASPDDVRLVEWEEGLQFACMGFRPERRLLLEAVYGFLTLKSGVPVGYVLTSALLGSSEVAYNVFDTYRGGEAGVIYGRVLATVRHLFGSDAFTILPYQLGDDNEEAIRSGAWWFYQKVGFRPRHPEARRLMRGELRRMARDPAHRSTPATLRALAAHNLYYFLDAPRRGIIGDDLLATIGLRVTDHLAARFGADREAAARACERQAAARLGLRSLRGFTPGARLAWERWAPLVTLLPGVERWPAADRRALVEVIRAKGGRRESDFVLRFDRHQRLRRALLALARR
jgi:hypothetical protein